MAANARRPGRPERRPLIAPTQLSGSAFGLLAGIQNLGNLTASTIVGLIWTTLSPSRAFAYLATSMAIALTALIRR